MSLKWSIGLMTGTVNDGYIDIAAIRTDGTDIIEFGPFELFPYKDQTIKELIFKTYEEARKWNFKDVDPDIFTLCLLYTSPSPRDVEESRMPSSA